MKIKGQWYSYFTKIYQSISELLSIIGFHVDSSGHNMSFTITMLKMFRKHVENFENIKKNQPK